MNTSNQKIILFPVTEEKLSRRQKDHILRTIEEITLSEIDDYVKARPDLEMVVKLCQEVPENERAALFTTAKELCDVEYISYKQLEALSQIGAALEIGENETGFSFDLYSGEEKLKYEYNRLLINYSIVTSIISFMPFSFLKNILFTTPLQTLMVTNIARLYHFDMDAKNFIRLAGGTTGVNLLFRLISTLLSLLLPFKWFLHASMSFASTYAIGVLAKVYIEANGEINEDTLHAMFESAYEEGKLIFNQFKEYILKNRDKLVKDFKESFKQKIG